MVGKEQQPMEALSQLKDHIWKRLFARPSDKAFRPGLRKTGQIFSGPLPKEGLSIQEVADTLLNHLVPYPTGNQNRRFFAWLVGATAPEMALPELIRGALNINAFGGAQAATLLELQVLDFIKQLLGLPKESSGILTSGAAEANLLALKVARDHKLSSKVQKEGLFGFSQHPRWYCSEQAHQSISQTIDSLGLGTENLVYIATDRSGALQPEHLQRQLQADREAGHLPTGLIATLGTPATGGFDPLLELANIAEEQRLWLHVDGAFGAWAALTKPPPFTARQLSRADSWALDLHKSLGVPQGCGVLLVKQQKLHRQAFQTSANYLTKTPGGLLGHRWFAGDYSLQSTRPARCIGAWWALVRQGEAGLEKRVQKGLEVAQAAYQQLEQDADFQVYGPPQLQVLCFRALGPSPQDTDLDWLQKRLITELSQQGIAVFSGVQLGGELWMRAAFCHPDTQLRDWRAVVEATKTLAVTLKNGALSP